jgi:hypothetical protein
VDSRSIAVIASTLLACGGASVPPPPVAPVAVAAPLQEIKAPAAPIVIERPELTRAPSTATYDEALSTPEPVDVTDERLHLTDVQLTSPMNNVLRGCTLPSNAKLTIKTAVQHGRAIGVSVDVHFEDSKNAKRPSRATQKVAAKISACIEHNVRETVWPPNQRRDSFTMEF